MGTCLNRGGPGLRQQHRWRRVICTLRPINQAPGLHHLGVKAVKVVKAAHPGPALEQVNAGNRGKQPMHKGRKTVTLA